MALITDALTMVPQVRAYLIGKDANIPTEHDALLEFLVNAVSEDVKLYCAREFRKQTYTDELYVGHGRQMLLLKHRPIVTVTTVKETDIALAATEWSIHDAEAGMLFREKGWHGGSYALADLTGDVHPFAVKFNYKVTYDAGYVLPKDGSTSTPRTLPFSLERAVVEICAALYKHRDNVGLKSKTYGGFESGSLSETYALWPEHAVATLDRFKEVA